MPVLWKMIKKCDHESSRRRTDTQMQTDFIICYSYGTDNNNKYAELSATYEFQPVAVETGGELSISNRFFIRLTWAASFLNVLANRLKCSYYSSGSVSWFKGSIQSSFTSLSQLRMMPTRNHSSLFLLLVIDSQDLYFLRVQKIITS